MFDTEVFVKNQVPKKGTLFSVSHCDTVGYVLFVRMLEVDDWVG